MNTLRLLSLLLPLAVLPGCVVAGEGYPAGYAPSGPVYGGGYGYVARPTYVAPRYYAPAPTYYAPRPARYFAPPPRPAPPPRVRYYAPAPQHHGGPPPGHWRRSQGENHNAQGNRGRGWRDDRHG